MSDDDWTGDPPQKNLEPPEKARARAMRFDREGLS